MTQFGEKGHLFPILGLESPGVTEKKFAIIEKFVIITTIVRWYLPPLKNYE
jgi:hypothetical protein